MALFPHPPLPGAEPVSLPGPGASSSWEEPAPASGGSQQPGGAGLETDGLFSSLKLARFVQHHSSRWGGGVPAPSKGKHHGLGGTGGGFGTGFLIPVASGGCSWRQLRPPSPHGDFFPFSLQDSLSAGPGKGVSVLQEGKQKVS